MYYQIVYFTKTDRVGVRTASTLEQARKIANEIRKKRRLRCNGWNGYRRQQTFQC